MADGVFEIRCGKAGPVFVLDENGNDSFDGSDRICRTDELRRVGFCYSEPLSSEEVKSCLRGLGVNLAVPLARGKSLSVLSELSEILDFIRYGKLSEKRLGEVAGRALTCAKKVGVDFDEKLAARIATEGSVDLMEAELALAERLSASPSFPDLFGFESRLAEARKHAKDAGVDFDEEKVLRILRVGYSRSHEAAKNRAELLAGKIPNGFDLEDYTMASSELDEVLDSVRMAAVKAGAGFSEEWASKLRVRVQKNVYEGIAQMLSAAVENIETVYDKNSFFMQKGGAGLDFISGAVTCAKESASRGGFDFDEERFEKLAQALCEAVYEMEKRLTEMYSLRPGSRFYLEVDFFPRARMWARIAGITYDEAWEEEIRERAADAEEGSEGK